MSKQVGGRGKKAPYQSTHVRLPLPIKDKVEELKELFLNGELELYEESLKEDKRLADEYRKMLTGIDKTNNTTANLLTGYQNALEEARKILKQKKSAKESVAKLLTALYGIETDGKTL